MPNEGQKGAKMAAATVKAVNKKIGKEVAVTYDFGEDLSSSVKLFSDKVVHGGFLDSAVISLQSRLRDWTAKGKSPQECQALASQWKPGVGGVRVMGDPSERYRSYLNTLSESDQLAQLEQLKKLIAEKKAAISQPVKK